MPQTRLLLLFAVCSLSACGHGPKVTVCLIDAAHLTLECSDPSNHQTTRQIIDSDNYVCLSPTDAEKVVDYAKTHCKQ